MNLQETDVSEIQHRSIQSGSESPLPCLTAKSDRCGNYEGPAYNEASESQSQPPGCHRPNINPGNRHSSDVTVLSGRLHAFASWRERHIINSAISDPACLGAVWSSSRLRFRQSQIDVIGEHTEMLDRTTTSENMARASYHQQCDIGPCLSRCCLVVFTPSLPSVTNRCDR
ncbi:hypothetical protein J6590_008833 [Homalodisca vitripennis]|nr:hypothetical protein J6590_008833 [Homalodisca vitripennis]